MRLHLHPTPKALLYCCSSHVLATNYLLNYSKVLCLCLSQGDRHPDEDGWSQQRTKASSFSGGFAWWWHGRANKHDQSGSYHRCRSDVIGFVQNTHIKCPEILFSLISKWFGFMDVLSVM